MAANYDTAEFTADRLTAQLPGLATALGHLATNLVVHGGVDAVTTTGATLDITVLESTLAVSGTMTATLPSGTVTGQRKVVRCISAASTPNLTLTVTNPETASGFVCAATFCFDAVGQEVEFLWTGSKWRAARVKRAGGSGVDGVVVGTTVINGTGASLKNLWATYTLSVTGTVTSTSTKAIPDGSAVGEIIQVGCSTAGGTPSGTIQCTGITTLGASGTKTLGTFNATTVWASLMWNGLQWQQTGGVTAVLA